MRDTFTIIYRTGGTERCEWRRVLKTFPTREAAQSDAVEIERMGYKTLIHKTAMLESIGMPVGWDA